MKSKYLVGSANIHRIGFVMYVDSTSAVNTSNIKWRKGKVQTIFWLDIGDQEKSWAPHFISGRPQFNLEGWLRGSERAMSLAVSRV